MTARVIISNSDEMIEGTVNLFFTDTRVTNSPTVVLNSAHRAVVTGNPHNVLASQITDFESAVTANVSVAANTTHSALTGWNAHGSIATGDVSVTAGSLTLADQVDALTSGDYALQFTTGTDFSATEDIGFDFNAPNWMTDSTDHLFRIRNNSETYFDMDWYGTVFLRPYADGRALDIATSLGNVAYSGIKLDYTSTAQNKVQSIIDITMEPVVGSVQANLIGLKVYVPPTSAGAVQRNYGAYFDIAGNGGSSKGVYITGDPEIYLHINATANGNPTAQLFYMTANSLSGNRDSSVMNSSSTSSGFQGALIRGKLTGTSGAAPGEFLILENSTGEIVNWNPSGNLEFIADNIGTVYGATNDGSIIWDGPASKLVLDATLITSSGFVEVVGGFHTTGARIKNVTRYATTDTILVTDEQVNGDTNSAGFTLTLPAGAQGATHKVTNVGTSGNNLTLDPDGTELLIGLNSGFTLTDGESLDITYDTTDGWY